MRTLTLKHSADKVVVTLVKGKTLTGGHRCALLMQALPHMPTTRATPLLLPFTSALRAAQVNGASLHSGVTKKISHGSVNSVSVCSSTLVSSEHGHPAAHTHTSLPHPLAPHPPITTCAQDKKKPRITVDLPGMVVSIVHAEGKKAGTFAAWLDVYVTLTKSPSATLGGVLGATFPKGDVSAASAATAFTASIGSTFA